MKLFTPAKKILISGAGIAGLTMARQCKKLGLPFKLIEKKPQLITTGAGIALPANAMRALRYLELGHSIDQQAFQVKEIIYTEPCGNTLSRASLLTKPLNQDKFVALSRSKLHKILCDKLEDNINFNTSIKSLTPTAHGVNISFDNPEMPEEQFSAVIGADGIHSRVRELTFNSAPLTDHGVTNWRWMCDFPTENLQPTYMLGTQDAFMVYPCGINKVYCYAHAFDPDGKRFKQGDHQQNIRAVIGYYQHIAQDILDRLPESKDIIVGRLQSVSQALFAKDSTALIGDASSACSPMLQQGAACAFEDVFTLSRLLRKHPIQEAFIYYQALREERVKWIIKSSDTPLKSIVNIPTPEQLDARNQMIKKNGPLNVSGWKILLSQDPIQEALDFEAISKALNKV